MRRAHMERNSTVTSIVGTSMGKVTRRKRNQALAPSTFGRIVDILGNGGQAP